jgi:aconitase A
MVGVISLTLCYTCKSFGVLGLALEFYGLGVAIWPVEARYTVPTTFDN